MRKTTLRRFFAVFIVPFSILTFIYQALLLYTTINSTKQPQSHVHAVLRNFHESQPQKISNPHQHATPSNDKWLDSQQVESFLRRPLTNGTSHKLPAWLNDYIQWHAVQISNLDADNWKSHRFLLLRCLDADTKCGGLSDRLKPLPLLLVLAAISNRILLIRWERPVPLEAFLQPARLDWRLPAYLHVQEAGVSSQQLFQRVQNLLEVLCNKEDDQIVVQVRLQVQHGGSPVYNALEDRRLAGGHHWPRFPTDIVNETHFSSTRDISNDRRHFRNVFRSVWEALFVPSHALAQAIRQHPISLLGPNETEYVAAHARTHYGNRPIPPGPLRVSFAVNALRCASTLRQSPHESVVLLSDSNEVLRAAQNYRDTLASEKQGSSGSIQVSVAKEEPLHLDQAASRRSSDYMSVFLDLYLMANANCISHDRGGFGRFGVLLSRNSSCFLKTFRAGRSIRCPEWKSEFAEINHE